MSDRLETPATENLNAGDIENLPVCPMNPTVQLENADGDHMYKRANPDTRWFKCPGCDCHLGYHRMRKKWLADPFDLDTNNKLRECFGLPSVEEMEEPAEE